MTAHRNVQVIVEYPKTEKYEAFRDALYIPMDEYARLSEDEIAARGAERYNNWKALQDSPPEPEPAAAPVAGEPTQLEVMRDQTQALLDQLNAAIAQAPAQETPAAEA